MPVLKVIISNDVTSYKRDLSAIKHEKQLTNDRDGVLNGAFTPASDQFRSALQPNRGKLNLS
jgi:hypothetical protein